MEVVKPQKPPYLEEHYRGQPSSYQLGKILFHHGQELLGRKTHRSDMERLAADLMAPNASKSQVKIRDAAWAKRDEVWAEYHRACRKYEEAQRNELKSRRERAKEVDYGNMLDSGEEDDEGEDLEDLAFVKEYEDKLRKKKARLDIATEPTGDIKLVLRALDLDALRELVESQSVQDDKIETYWSSRDVQDALDVVEMDDSKEDELCAAIAVLLDHAAEVRELRGDEEPPKKSRSIEKKEQNKRKADEKAKELRGAFEEMQRAYEANRPEAIHRFAEKLQELSNEPAFTAMARYGMCECSASHALAKALGLLLAAGAENYWRAHPVSALREPLDAHALLLEIFGRVPDLSGADSVSSIMMLRLDGVEVAPPRRRRRRRCGSVTGPSRAGAGTASEQWAMLASEACSYVEVELPPEIEFDEVKVRGNYEGRKNYSERTEKGRENLDKAVTWWTDVSGDELAALSRPEKIESIVEARRKAHQAPIDQISRAAEPLFDSLVKCRTSAAEFCDVQTCVEVIGHGHAYATTSHCGFLDADKVDHYIAKFKAAKKAGSITDAEYFYFDGSGHRDREHVTTGHRLTESLRSEDSPLSMMGAEGRISIIGKGELYATDLSKTKLVLGFIVDGGVRNVDDVETSVDGRLVVALHRRGELYFFLIGRGQFLLANKLTPACAVKILQIAGPLLHLTYRQDTGAVPRLKKEALDDGGLVVGKSTNRAMIGDFKVNVPKMVARGVSKGLIEFE
jgi:hypothetical protein